MLCDRCGKDFCAWTELHSIRRMDTRTEWVCWQCLGWADSGKNVTRTIITKGEYPCNYSVESST